MANIFEGTKAVASGSDYKASYRGITDFTNLNQFDMFETGHSFLILIKGPRFMAELAKTENGYNNIVSDFEYMLENEFRGLTGLPDISGETSEITDGVSNLNLITKVQMDTAVNVSMSFWEKSGGMIGKYMELYLTGIKDPKTQAKHYHGLIDAGIIEPGFENEIFQLLYVVCDNTYRNLEKAFLLCNWQPNKAETSMYDSTKGTIEFKEITIEGSCYPVTGPAVNKRAKAIMQAMCSYYNDGEGNYAMALGSNQYGYSAIKSGSDFANK